MQISPFYITAKIAGQHGYEIVQADYGNFPKGVKGSAEKMEAAFFSALEQAEEKLREIDFSDYEDVLLSQKRGDSRGVRICRQTWDSDKEYILYARGSVFSIHEAAGHRVPWHGGLLG